MKLSADIEDGMTKRIYCGPAPLVIGHRGASGYTPEHTLHAYEVALNMGADYIEPDLVMTKDRYVIVRHENEISETTDVAIQFPNRKRTKVIDGKKIEGYFSEDFTLAEIKSLRAKERLPFRSPADNGKYEIPTFEEVLAFAKLEEHKRGRKIGVAPELKHSTYFHSIGHKGFEREVVRLLRKYDYNKADSKVLVQSFEIENLKELRKLTPAPLVQLLGDANQRPADRPDLTYAQMATPAGLKEIRTYANWVSPHKAFVVAVEADGLSARTTSFVADAKAADLKVVAYTFRSDEAYLAELYQGDPAREYRLFFNQGLDAVFSDFPDHAVAVKREFETPCP